MKKSVRKLICLLLCAETLLSLAACAGNDTPTTSENGGPATDAPAATSGQSNTSEAITTSGPEASEPVSTEPQPAGHQMVGMSFDTLLFNGKMANNPDGNAGKWLDKNVEDRLYDISDGSVTDITFRGWVGFDVEIDSFGYRFGNNEPVFSKHYTFLNANDIQAVRAKENGGKFAERFAVIVDADTLSGDGELTVVAKLADGTVFDLKTDEEHLSIKLKAGTPAVIDPSKLPDKNSALYKTFRTDNFAAGKLSDALLDSVNPGVLALLSECMYYESELQKGIARGEKWVYSNSSTYVPQSGTFDAMLASGKCGSNCALPQAWAFVELGVIKNGKHIYGNSAGNLANISAVEDYIKTAAKIHYLGGVTKFYVLYDLGLVKPGDIFYAKGHTFIYLGDEKFMAAGHDGKWHTDETVKTEDAQKAVFETWIMDMKECMNWEYTVFWMIRFNDDYIPEFYRNAEGKLVQNPVFVK